MKLTKETVKRLYAAEPEVSMMNGYFMAASVVAKFARHHFMLEVEVTHPSLAKYGKFDSVKLWHFQGSVGVSMPVPDELKDLVQKLTELATMSDEQVMVVDKEMQAVVHSFNKNFY